jgi:hypothetical protein
MTTIDPTAPQPSHSPGPWGYEYNPYTLRRSGKEPGEALETELPAYEVFDNDGNKVFDTNEDAPAEEQEANARLGSAAPRLLAALLECVRILADHEESEGEEGLAYRCAIAAIAEATGV